MAIFHWKRPDKSRYTEAGRATPSRVAPVLADILLGKAAPSGKLTTTWSAWADYPSMGEFGDINDTRYNEGIYIGYRYFDSVDTFPCAIARLDADVVTMKTKNCCGKPDFADWKPEQKVQASMPENLPVLELCANDFATAMAAYDKEHEIDPEVGIFTNEQLALMNTGAFDPKGSLSSIIGSASKTVAGAAGETANATGAKDFPVMVMADGPTPRKLPRPAATW